MNYDLVSKRARKRAQETTVQRADARAVALANPRRPWVAEPDAERRHRFERRPGAESVHETPDFQPVAFLEIGTRVSRSVARVVAGGEGGSGFLISPDLFITNHHVIGSVDQASVASIEFNYQLDGDDRLIASTRFTLDPARCFITAADDDLDFTIVAIKPDSAVGTLATFGYCPLSDRDDKHAIGMPVNIVQHPRLLPKSVVLRNNLLVERIGRVLQYETDTDVGSSGSPVFNDTWDVVALHHWGEPFLERKDASGRRLAANVNEGVRASKIVERTRTVLAKQRDDARAMLEKALGLATKIDAMREDDAAPVIHLSTKRESFSIPLGADSMPDPTTVSITIPLEITLRFGAPQNGGSTATTAITAAVVQAVAPVQVPIALPPIEAPDAAPADGAEGVTIDKNYANRKGYDPAFIEGTKIPLPKPKNASVIAPLLSGTDTELKYIHYSLRIHKDRKMALYTATNIDGKAYLKIIRATGKPQGAEGSDVWFDDPRIDVTRYTIRGDFYAKTSTYFDKGHLTRREDPTWGPAKLATSANADTFHYANCTPQHFLFNESVQYWQGIEQYVLEKGAVPTKNKLCVFQGPVLDDGYAEFQGIRVPLMFWKIVAWRGKDNKMKSAAFKVDQTKLLDLKRSSGRPPSVKGKDYVAEYRVQVSALTTATGLDFGDIAKWDTFKSPGKVGEAIKVIKSWNDVL